MKFAVWNHRRPTEDWQWDICYRELRDLRRAVEELSAVSDLQTWVQQPLADHSAEEQVWHRCKLSSVANWLFGSKDYARDRETSAKLVPLPQIIDILRRQTAAREQAIGS